MAKYRKQKTTPTRSYQADSSVLGMLYLVRVRFEDRRTREITSQRLLLVGGEQQDIERKLRWIYEADQYSKFSIIDIEKVREKIHVISTSVTQPHEPSKNVVTFEDGRQQEIVEPPIPMPDLIHYAVGLTTRVYARDHYHAIRKIASALETYATEGPTSSTARLSADSKLQIEEIGKPDAFAKARDVSNVKARAQFVRG